MTRKLTPAQLDEIEAAAKEATPGEWVHDEFGEVHGSNGESLFFGDAAGYALPISRAIAEHIAMMDPATTLALVAEVRELRAKVERVREVHQMLAMHLPARLNFCSHCLDDEFGRPMPADWPCDTIKALGEEA